MGSPKKLRSCHYKWNSLMTIFSYFSWIHINLYLAVCLQAFGSFLNLCQDVGDGWSSIRKHIRRPRRSQRPWGPRSPPLGRWHAEVPRFVLICMRAMDVVMPSFSTDGTSLFCSHTTQKWGEFGGDFLLAEKCTQGFLDSVEEGCELPNKRQSWAIF